MSKIKTAKFAKFLHRNAENGLVPLRDIFEFIEADDDGTVEGAMRLDELDAFIDEYDDDGEIDVEDLCSFLEFEARIIYEEDKYDDSDLPSFWS